MPSVLRWFPRWCKKILLGESATKLNEIADVLVRFDHVASIIVNANHSIM